MKTTLREIAEEVIQALGHSNDPTLPLGLKKHFRGPCCDPHTNVRPRPGFEELYEFLTLDKKGGPQ